MSLTLLTALAVGAAAGGFVNGLAGFGTALFALGIWLHVMPPLQAIAITLVLSLFSGLFGIWRIRTAIHDNPVRLLRFLVPGIVGVPFGVMLLSHLDASILKLVIAGFLILFGGIFSARTVLPRIERPMPLIDMVVGFGGGVLGGSTSLAGPLPIMWCSMRAWPKSETRAVLQPYSMTILGLTALTFASKGLFDRETLLFIAITLPFHLLAALTGIHAFRRLTDAQFRRLLITLMLVSGLILAARELI